MKNKLKLIIGLGVVTFLVSLITFKVYVVAQSEKTSQQEKTSQLQQSYKKTKNQEKDDKATPKVIYQDLGDEKINVNSPRGNKNRKFDKFEFVLDPNSAEGAGEVIRYDENRVSAIPTKDSNLILIGTVVNSQAFLSSDKTGIYSEFTTQIEKLIKNTSNQSLNKGDTLPLEREGGVVQYPSGKTVRYKIFGKGSPAINSKYIFFLKQVSDNSFEILTAYELMENSVFPLDGTRLSLIPGDESDFDSHANENVQNFINKIERENLNN